MIELSLAVNLHSPNSEITTLKTRATWKLFLMALIIMLSKDVFAAPTLHVIDHGPNALGNRQWRVYVSPDINLFSMSGPYLGAALAIELEFKHTLSAFRNVTRPINQIPYLNPGLSSLQPTPVTGILVAGQTAFIALGSKFVINPLPVLFATLETQGSAPSQLSWGGKTMLSGTPHQYVTGLLAQNGQQFAGQTGMRNSGIMAQSSACETQVDKIYKQCSGYLDNKTASYRTGCAGKLDPALTACADYSTIFTICSEVAIYVDQACTGTDLNVCNFFKEYVGRCLTALE